MELQHIVLAFGIYDNILVDLFGWLTRVFYNFFGNYGLAIIALTIVVRGLLIPLNVTSQRSLMKQQALADKQAEIKRRYPDDKNKQNEEMTKLLQENGAFSPLGCFLPILQIIFIFPIFGVVRAPLRYIAQVSSANLTAMGELFNLKATGGSFNSYNIPIVEKLQNSASALHQAIDKGFMTAEQMIDMKFLGLDLSVTPAWNPMDIAKNTSTYVPLLVIPLLVLLTTILMNRMTTLLKPGQKNSKEAKEERKRAKQNAARAGQVPTENTSEAMMNTMIWIMPVIMLVTTFSMPAAMGFYWIIGNIMGVVQQLIIYFMFTKPLELKKKEFAEKKAAAFAKKAHATDATVESPKGKYNRNASKTNGTKKK